MSFAKNDSRATLIRHLRNELDDVKKSCEKYEELNAAMVTLENNLKALKEEKDAENQEAQLKCQDLMTSIKEAEILVTELREECKEGEKVASDVRNQMERVNSDLAFMESKETALTEKIEGLSAFITELNNNRNNLREGTDLVKKELVEMKSNFAMNEKDQLDFEERLSKLNLQKRARQTELADLETKEKRFALLKGEREIERDQLTVLFNKKTARLSDLTWEIGQLENQDLDLTKERAVIKSAVEQVGKKQMQEEQVANETRGEIHSLENKINHIDDEQRVEDANYIKAADLLNDEKEKNAQLAREGEKLKACLYSLEELCGKVSFASANS